MKGQDKEKKDIVRLYYFGVSISDIIERHGISKSTFYRWLKRYADPELEAQNITIEKVRTLKSRIMLLQEENHKLKEYIIARGDQPEELLRSLKG